MEKPLSVQRFRHLLLASRTLMFEERRRHYRAPVLETVTCQWDKRRVEGQSVNLSTSGILLSLEKTPPQGAEVYVNFTLPDSSYRISLPAKVARVTPEGQVGLRFFGFKHEVRERMTKFVDLSLRRATRSYYEVILSTFFTPFLLYGEPMAKRKQPGRDLKHLTSTQLKEAYPIMLRNRCYIVREEKLYPPEHPLRLTFQHQRALVDVRIKELKEAAETKGLTLGSKS